MDTLPGTTTFTLPFTASVPLRITHINNVALREPVEIRPGETIEATVRELRGGATAPLIEDQSFPGGHLTHFGAMRSTARPQTGESTAPLTEDQVATLVELVRADRREDFDTLVAALGVVNGPALWDGTQRRLAP